MEKVIRVVGQMDNSQDHTFESANRVHDRKALCPTIPTCSGGYTSESGEKIWTG